MKVIGALAALQLGPDALNLAGARHGACRLGHALRQELGMPIVGPNKTGKEEEKNPEPIPKSG